MRHTIGNESMETLSEITLSVLGQQEEEIDEDERFARYLLGRLNAVRLRRAEATLNVDECDRKARMARGALQMIEQECDEEEAAIQGFQETQARRRLENDQEKLEAARACERAGFAYVHASLKVAEVTA